MAEADAAPSGDARPPALFLDFDGTLVDIAERPDAVAVEPGLPEVLRGLKGQLGGALAVVTGRALADVERYLPGLGLDICGLHGLERRVGGVVTAPELPDLAAHVADLRARFRTYPGAIVEDKTVGVAVHWRMAPEAEAAAKSALGDLALRLGPAYRLQEGKAVIELVPAAAGKGASIRAVMELPPYLGRLPVFAGDDRTDEHGFEAVNELGGLTVKVGPGPTQALYRIESASAFRRWLARWRDLGTVPDLARSAHGPVES